MKQGDTYDLILQGNGTVWTRNIRCKGSESKLTDCPGFDFGEGSCSHSQDASVSCSIELPSR